MKNKKYILELNEKQVNQVLISLDFYSRICCGQLQKLKEVSNSVSEETLTKLQKEMFPTLEGLHHSFGIAGKETPEEAKICYDIYKQIHFVFNPIGVYAYKPSPLSKEELPDFQVKEEQDKVKIGMYKVQITGDDENKNSGCYSIMNSGESAGCYDDEVYIVNDRVIAKLKQDKIKFEILHAPRTDNQEEKQTKDWTCSKCGKKYKTYSIILDDNELSVACELDVREKYYNQELKKGLCEKCSEEIRK